ncbi:winged helix-turn-helix transcriptional regulator [Streptomyces scopuliridis]|uniref:winged helix-turn-helix transcriptional regulator n=1 Tax=Streptomyces scopuliridis TaxID=452529 RepID=UPI0036A63E99
MAITCTTGRHAEHDVYAAQCPCRDVLDLLANKWAALAIGALEEGPRRFGALQRRLQGVSPKVLTSTLRRLEDHGFVDRTVYPAVPLHVEYALTALGVSVAEPLGQVRAWVENHLDEIRSSGTEEAACVTAGGDSPH